MSEQRERGMRQCKKCGAVIEQWMRDQYEKLQDMADERRPGRERGTGPSICGTCLGRAVGLIDPPDRGDLAAVDPELGGG